MRGGGFFVSAHAAFEKSCGGNRVFLYLIFDIASSFAEMRADYEVGK